MDSSRYIEFGGKTYFQLGFTGVIPEKNKVYGIKSSEDASQIGALVEVEDATPIATADAVGTVKPDGTTITVGEDGTISCTETTMSSLLALLVTKQVITQEEADEILPST